MGTELQISWLNKNKQEQGRLFVVSEPVCGISIEVAKREVRDWTINDHSRYLREAQARKDTHTGTLG
jgi:hypothetical protein